MTTLPVNVEPTRCGAMCVCQDPDVDRLRTLIAAGVDQGAVSRMIWSPNDPPGAPAPALQILDPGKYARRLVRHALATALPWLRLPTEVS